MKRVALTGGIATGKSHVRAEFERLGVPTIDADTLARHAVAPGSPGFAKVVERFGQTILAPDGSLDRQKLGALVFSDAKARRDLERIIHPDVQHSSDAWFASLPPGHPFAIADIPLLFEIGRDRDFDATVVVACDPATQLQRLMKRDGLSEPAARQRIEAQLPIDEKVKRADYVIRTDGSFEDTKRQVKEAYGRLVVSG